MAMKDCKENKRENPFALLCRVKAINKSYNEIGALSFPLIHLEVCLVGIVWVQVAVIVLRQKHTSVYHLDVDFNPRLPFFGSLGVKARYVSLTF